MVKAKHSEEFLQRKAFEYAARNGEYPTVNDMAERYVADRNRLTQILREQKEAVPFSSIYYAAAYLLGTTPRELAQRLQKINGEIDLGGTKNELRAMAALNGMKPKEIEALSRDELRGRLKRVKSDDFLKQVGYTRLKHLEG